MENNAGNMPLALLGFAIIILTAAIVYRAKNHELFIQYAMRERRQLLETFEEITQAITKAYEEIQSVTAEVQTATTFKYITADDESGDLNETETTMVPQTLTAKMSALQNNISLLNAHATTMGLDILTKRIKKLQQAIESYAMALKHPTPQMDTIENAIQEIDISYELFITTVATEKLFADTTVVRASLPLYQRQKYTRKLNRKIHVNKLHIHHLKQQLNHLRNSSQEDLLEEELKNIIGIM